MYKRDSSRKHQKGRAGPSVLNGSKGEKLGLVEWQWWGEWFQFKTRSVPPLMPLSPSLPCQKHPSFLWVYRRYQEPSYCFMTGMAGLSLSLISQFKSHFLRESFPDYPLLFSITPTSFWTSVTIHSYAFLYFSLVYCLPFPEGQGPCVFYSPLYPSIECNTLW